MLSNPPAAQRLSHDKALGDFAQVLTHRIRNLLAGIEGFTDLLTDTLGSREQRELALRILESTARIEFVLNDLQYYSQPVRLISVPVYVEDVLDQLTATLDEKALHRVTVSVEPIEGRLMADPGLLRQALLSLIQNALEALAEDEHATLRITYDDAARTICFNVWNQGTIKVEEAAAKVFEPFFTTKANNLGIGLSIARRIAEAHGGTLTLTANDPRRGTCFSLALPMPTTEEIRCLSDGYGGGP